MTTPYVAPSEQPEHVLVTFAIETFALLRRHVAAKQGLTPEQCIALLDSWWGHEAVDDPIVDAVETARAEKDPDGALGA